MKKAAIFALVTAIIFMTGAAFAAPLTDYSAGKTAIDLNFRNSDAESSERGESFTFGKKIGLDWGITTGLGKGFAFQYNSYNAKSADLTSYHGIGYLDVCNCEFKTQEFNALYKLNRNISVYAGLVTLKGIANHHIDSLGTTYIDSRVAETSNKIQTGVIGSTKIGSKIIAYAQVGVASRF